MLCINGCSECDGCGACQQSASVMTDEYGIPIYEGEPYFEINGIIYSEESFDLFRKLA